MGQVGFGAYRISIKSQSHYEALKSALEAGCALIDTSSNYTNGDSERLIGQILKDNPKFSPLIVSKAGYIQGDNLIDIITNEDLVDLGNSLKHSIHPKFLEDQITKSLNRLGIQKIDIFLLHNPEYYFELPDAKSEEFYNRIEKALVYLNSEVLRGRIGSFGISSNNFVLPHNSDKFVNLEKIIELAKKNNILSNFSYIQFPFNLIEIGALEKYGEYGEISLLDLARLNGIKTISNRPLNAFKDNQLIRLAKYNINLNEAESINVFNNCINLLEAKWIQEQKNEGSEDIESVKDLLLLKQFSEMWNKLPTPDAVDQVYYGHFFPFLAQVWGGSLTVEESRPFYDLYEYSLKYSRLNMSNLAMQFRKQAISVGLINEISEDDFAKEVIETYLSYGIDYVLVGMKNVEYVNQLKYLFQD